MNKKLKSILLVDDDADDNFFHQMVIEDMNITENIHIARNGIEALEFLNDENNPTPDIIFLDINMPRMNGWEFLEAYNKLEMSKKANVVVAILTTSQNPADIKKAEQFASVKCFNSKSLTEKMMRRIFDDYLSEHGMD